MRSQPLILTILFLIVVCVFTTLDSLIQTRYISLPFLSRGPFFNFPFPMAILVWLASRHGRVSWKTWAVPAILLVLTLAIQTSGYAFVRMPEHPFYFLTQMKMAPYIWDLLKSHLYCCVLLVFLLRFSTLHLHPIEMGSCPPSGISIRLMLGLTIVVALCLKLDAAQNQSQGLISPQLTLGALSIYWMFYLFRLMPALVWASVAGLFVASNTRRWIGWIGLALAFAWLCIQLFLLTQFQGRVGDGWGSAFARWPELVAILRREFFALLCVGAMHLAGYRWDIRRDTPSCEQLCVSSTAATGVL